MRGDAYTQTLYEMKKKMKKGQKQGGRERGGEVSHSRRYINDVVVFFIVSWQAMPDI